MLDLVTCLIRTPLFEHYMLRYIAPKMELKKYMCLRDIGQNVQNMIIVPCSIANRASRGV